MGKSRVTRLRKSELTRLKRLWRDSVREFVKRLPSPDSAEDQVALFDVVIEELKSGRKMVKVLWPKTVA